MVASGKSASRTMSAAWSNPLLPLLVLRPPPGPGVCGLGAVQLRGPRAGASIVRMGLVQRLLLLIAGLLTLALHVNQDLGIGGVFQTPLLPRPLGLGSAEELLKGLEVEPFTVIEEAA